MKKQRGNAGLVAICVFMCVGLTTMCANKTHIKHKEQNIAIGYCKAPTE